MYCALEEVEITKEACPAKCMYRCSDGRCAHADLAYRDSLTSSEIANVLKIPIADVEEDANRAKKRIQAALVAEAYISYAVKEESINIKDKKYPAIFRLLKVTPERLRQILLRSKYDTWKKMSGAEVPFETICLLFKKVLSNA